MEGSKMKAMLMSWKTTLCGILTLICAGSTLTVLPEKYQAIGHATCTILLAFGVIASKDANVTNAAIPVEAQKVPGSAPAAPTTVKVG